MKIDSKYYVTVIVPVLNKLAKRYYSNAEHWFPNKKYSEKRAHVLFVKKI